MRSICWKLRSVHANEGFLVSCGHHLLDRDSGGGLVVTDEFLRFISHVQRLPHAAPEACVVERIPDMLL